MSGEEFQWIYPLSFVLLAGGDSRRMKQDKALLPVQGVTLIEHILDQLEDLFQATFISVSDPRKFQFLKHQLIVDEKPGFGPMMGIKTALSISPYEQSFVMACDIPTIDENFLDNLIRDAKKNEITVSLSPGGRMEPLFAVYSKSVIPKIERLLKSGERSILSLLDICQIQTIQMDSNGWFKNLNTERDYRDFLKQIE